MTPISLGNSASEQAFTHTHINTYKHQYTHMCTHIHSASSESNFLCTPTVTALFTPGFHQSISISLALSSFHSQPASQPANYSLPARLAVSWGDRSMKQPLAPASVMGTANSSSGEITTALVKSHRHLVGHFLFPFKEKRLGGRWHKMV